MNTSEKDKDIILELAILLFQGKISHEQNEVLTTLLGKDLENRKYFNEILDAWIATSSYNYDQAPVDTNVSWIRISNKINPVLKSDQYGTKLENRFMHRLVKTAALWLFLVSLGAFTSWFVMQKQIKGNDTNISEVTTPLGSRSMIRLPDGSRVWLNAGSKLCYSQNSFRDNHREVYLEGEAYFDVSKIKRNMFIVKTSDINVKVYGTQFNVRSYPEENKIQTTLVNGSVAIEEKTKSARKNVFFLKPNQTATYYKIVENKPLNGKEIPNAKNGEKKDHASNIVIIPEPDPITKTSWKDDRWIIIAEDFGQLAIDMERRYNVNITFKDESLKDFKFSGTLADETFEQVMKIIQLSAPVRFRYIIENNNVELKYDENNHDPN